MKRTLSLLTILLIGVSSWAKKTSNPDIDGTIVDAQGQPLEFVNISLLLARTQLTSQAKLTHKGRNALF